MSRGHAIHRAPKPVRPRDARRAARRNAGRWAAALLLWEALALPLLGIVPAAAQEKPLRIGALLLGPRKMPVWHCGPRDPRQPAPGAAGGSTCVCLL